MSNSNKDVLLVDSITTGKPPAQRTKPPATSVVKKATGKGQQTARCQPAARNKFNALEYAETSDSQNSDKTTNITFDSLEYSSLTGEGLFATVRIQGERGPYNLRCKVDTGAPTSVISKRKQKFGFIKRVDKG